MRYVALLILLFQVMLLGMQSSPTNAACCLPKVLAFKPKIGNSCKSLSATIFGKICIKKLCGLLTCCGKCNIFCCGCWGDCHYVGLMGSFLASFEIKIEIVLGLRVFKSKGIRTRQKRSLDGKQYLL